MGGTASRASESWGWTIGRAVAVALVSSCTARLDFDSLSRAQDPVQSGDAAIDGGEAADAGVSDADAGCACGARESCTVDRRECLGFCEPPEDGVFPGALADPAPEPICEAREGQPPLSFAALCLARCIMRCRRIDWFCEVEAEVSDQCEAACAEEAELAACGAECPDDAERLNCMTNACRSVQAWTCAETVCSNGLPPVCRSDLTCFNEECPFNFDGYCDDGDTFETVVAEGGPLSDSDFCPWGHDCADCGPRYGPNVHVGRRQGELCMYDGSCAGHDVPFDGAKPDLSRNEAWCYPVSSDGLSRCVPDASGPGETCPAGYTVRMESDSDGNVRGVCVPDCAL